jgi:O-antigen/teichoic acid export membrane protein
VGTVMLAGRILTAVYGKQFAAAATCLAVLGVVIPVRMVGHTLGTSLTAANAQTPRTWCVTGAALMNIGVDLALVPRLSYVGAAWGTVLTETALAVAYAVLLRSRVGQSAILHALGVPSVAAVPLAAGIAIAWQAPLGVTVAAGAAGYALGLGALALLAGRVTQSTAGTWGVVTSYLRVAA